MQFPSHIPFVEMLGMELVSMSEGQAELRLPTRREHQNSFGVAHGGVLMTLLDVVMAHAARSLHADGEQGQGSVVTIEMKTTFFVPGQAVLRATAQVQHRTAKLAFCEGTVYNESGEACARASATFKFMRALPAKGEDGGRQIHPLNPPSAPSSSSPFRGSGSD